MIDIDLDMSGFIEVYGNSQSNSRGDNFVDVGLFDPDLAQIGFFNEYGTVTAPPRPFIRAGIDKNLEEYEHNMANQANDMIVNGQDLNIEEVGKKASLDVKRYASQLKEPKNAESTIKRKGFDNPLVDTGTMIESISYELGNENDAI